MEKREGRFALEHWTAAAAAAASKRELAALSPCSPFLTTSTPTSSFSLPRPKKKKKKKQVVKLKSFCKFDTTTDALAAATALVDSKMSKSLKKFLKKHADGDSLGVVDAKLGAVIKEKLGIACVASGAVSELSRGIRAQLGGLVSGLAGEGGSENASSSDDALAPMALGLAHSLSRYKLKFSPDKVDTMVVQAIGLLDDLDKELNTYAMRAREW